MTHNFLLLFYLWVPMILLRANCFLWLCHAQSKEETTFLSAALSSIWHICFPGCKEGSGVHRPPSARASMSGPRASPASRTPSPAFGSFLGWASPSLGWVTSQLCLQPLETLCLCLSQGPILAARQKAHCPSNTRGSHCLACASTWQRLLNQGALCLLHP